MRQWCKVFYSIVSILIMVACAAPAYAQSRDDLRFNVTLPGGGTVDIQMDIFVNPSKNAGSKTLLAVHGLAHTGATFGPLANELFKQTGNDKVKRVLAINFPGRNGSGVPSNLLFGNLTIEDYKAVLLGVLDLLPKQIKIETIVAHSLGALIVQLAQDDLVSSGTSLQKEFGIKNVYLLAPSLPSPITWSFAASELVAQIPERILDDDPALGLILRLLSDDPLKQLGLLDLWLGLFFTNTEGNRVLNTPSTDALALNYLSNEPLVMTLQLFGSRGLSRPQVGEGIFDSREQKCFRMVTFSEDLAVPPEDPLREHQELAAFLTGDAPAANLIFIDAPNAVHDMYISNPAVVAKALTSCN
jgi:pimeloyl-ACP methyl ester carboxylesterase